MPRGINNPTVQALIELLKTLPAESLESPPPPLWNDEETPRTPSPYPEKNIHLRYTSNGEVIEEEQSLGVEVIAPDRLCIKSSSWFFEDFKLYYGDEIFVHQIGIEDFELVSVVQPSAMHHFFFVGSGDPKVMTEPLHALGGEWECDAGGLYLVHVPFGKVEAFNQQTGLNLHLDEEVFSGFQDLDLTAI